MKWNALFDLCSINCEVMSARARDKCSWIALTGATWCCEAPQGGCWVPGEDWHRRFHVESTLNHGCRQVSCLSRSTFPLVCEPDEESALNETAWNSFLGTFKPDNFNKCGSVWVLSPEMWWHLCSASADTSYMCQHVQSFNTFCSWNLSFVHDRYLNSWTSLNPLWLFLP